MDTINKHESSKLVLIAGGSSSGKSTLARKLAEKLCDFRPAIVCMDNYYKDLSGRTEEFYREYNFDDPSALDEHLFADDVDKLLSGSHVEELRYDFATHSRLSGGGKIGPGMLVIAEGLFILRSERLAGMAGLKAFIDVPEETMFGRRLERDMRDRGRSAESVKAQFERFVLPAHRDFVVPSARKADIVLRDCDGLDKNVELLCMEIERSLGWAARNTRYPGAER